ncbi:5'-nucleotidase SurE [subsurface metagenome]
MQILLTNDDGIFAPGLAAIYKELVKIGNVTVVAPAESRSGASHSITFSRPLVCNKVDINGQFIGFSVQGSPADCVKLAVMQLHDGPIDLLVAGINNGANVGINIYYSGTVAAAMEGALLEIPAVAMSLAVEAPGVSGDFEKAAEYCTKILKKLMPVESGDVININIPQLSKGEPKGVRVVPQSSKGFDEYYIRQKNEQGQTVFQLAGEPNHTDETPTDTTSLVEGFITITALAPDMTNHEKTRQLEQIKWQENSGNESIS